MKNLRQDFRGMGVLCFVKKALGDVVEVGGGDFRCREEEREGGGCGGELAVFFVWRVEVGFLGEWFGDAVGAVGWLGVWYGMVGW